MPYHLTKMGMLVHCDPKKAIDELELVYRDCRGSQRAVARALKVAESTVKRWVKLLEPLGMRDRIHRIRLEFLP